MSRTLVILEVSRKQDYIFSSKRLRENAARSEEIRFVTSSPFFQEASDQYREDANLVYSGGGHTILQFDDAVQATEFTKQVTEKALRQFDSMEIYAKQLEYDSTLSPGDNLKKLSAALEAKKSLRRQSFRLLNFGVEELDGETFAPVRIDSLPEDKRHSRPEAVRAPDGWEFPVQLEDVAGGDNFIAVVHIDGNAMGKRVEGLYAKSSNDWELCKASLQQFSDGIDADFKAAFEETVNELVDKYWKEGKNPKLPIRPIILAGDDVCFVTAGNIGIECARVFLNHLASKTNQEDGMPYAACAGVAIVHQKYPFHRAYTLSEELCSSAKRFGASIDPDGRISAMDWHIEFGQLKDSLSDIRDDYETNDSSDNDCKRLELRPVVVLQPDGVPKERAAEQTGGVRTYSFFRAMSLAMKEEQNQIARGKIKDLREAFKQGEIESNFFMQDRQIGNLLYHGFSAEHAGNEVSAAYNLLKGGATEIDKSALRKICGIKRCIFFDAIELLDHCDFWEGANT